MEGIAPAVPEAKSRDAEAPGPAEPPAAQHSPERMERQSVEREPEPPGDREPAGPARELSFELELELLRTVAQRWACKASLRFAQSMYAGSHRHPDAALHSGVWGPLPARSFDRFGC